MTRGTADFRYGSRMTDIGLIYASVRERLSDLVRVLSDEESSTRVPACPDWSVHDTLAHLVGVVTDVSSGNLDGVGEDRWTAAQVDARRDVTITGMLDEWAQDSPGFEDGLRAFGGVMAQASVADAWNHEQDIRGALGVMGGRDLETELASLEGYIALRSADFADLAPLKFNAGETIFSTGDGEPGATVTAEPFELARMMCGRRTTAQMRSYGWDGDPEPYIAVLAKDSPPIALPC
ncbi:MAG: maleylpyruvate isomerase family mycothiol-dependent enzyme [Acidimicrobiia bacterium]|nr:maleylpyruvate isomerase family mycothiol-dependent enzyme [Acidimicrobiia bacterium]